MNDLIIYRTDFCGRDEEVVDTFVVPKARYICFTDRDKLPEPWEAWSPANMLLCPQMTARWHKLNPHYCLPPHRSSIYMDASIGLKKDPTPLLDTRFGVHPHRERRSMQEEAEFCIKIGIGQKAIVQQQLRYYLCQSHKSRGLWETGCLVRHNNEFTRWINRQWWEQVQTFTPRDQISLAYLHDKLDFVQNLPGNLNTTEYFHFQGHGGPLPVDEAEARRRFPEYMKRRDAWPSLNSV